MKRLSYLFITLLLFTVANCGKTSVAPEEQVTVDSPVTQRIVDNTDLIAEVYDDTVFQIAPGVKETDIRYQNKLGNIMHVFILRVDLNNPQVTLDAAMSYNGTTFDRQTVPDMAEEADSAGHRVVAAVNADFFTSTAPWGVAVKDGEVLKDTWSRFRSRTFLGTLSDGTPYIGKRPDFPAMQEQLEDALSGTEMLVIDNYILPQSIIDRHPRTGAGINDSGIVYFVVVDGRDSDYSNGMTLTQLGKMLKACGATKAMNLDGGGSSTFLIRRGDEWEVRNRPSDGTPRAVSNAWLVISGSLDE